MPDRVDAAVQADETADRDAVGDVLGRQAELGELVTCQRPVLAVGEVGDQAIRVA
ncbi:MAG TPA: hypothetical protein VFG42_20560 [Baekduia sp.]|nr:hypothetical protein [Baekduia sp.]HET6509200.1 hypothetical protein [Baekduia sp.]